MARHRKPPPPPRFPRHRHRGTTVLAFGLVFLLTGSTVANAAPEHPRQRHTHHHHHHATRRAHEREPDGDRDDAQPTATPTATPTPIPTPTPVRTTSAAPTATPAPTTTSAPATTTAPKPTPTPTATPTPTPSSAGPHGPSGVFIPTFNDEFSGSSLDRSKWSPVWYAEGGKQNGVATHASNVSVAGGHLALTLAGSNSGASINTDPADVPGGGYTFPVGSCVEARIDFPGSGTAIYNWPAWWASSVDGQYPSSGENDIAEGLDTLTINYHSPSGSHNQGTVPGVWSNAYHTYTLCRNTGSADVYWDGTLRKHYSTDDNGKPEMLILNVGAGSQSVYGTQSQVLVDYVRAWKRG